MVGDGKRGTTIECGKEGCLENRCACYATCDIRLKAEKMGVVLWMSEKRGVRNVWIPNPVLLGKTVVEPKKEEVVDTTKPSMNTFDGMKKTKAGK